ncbi:hypothetical protein [Allorhodopirellula solitaria]|nr:hypothetical protein [Allorhodopirellula solitaria]
MKTKNPVSRFDHPPEPSGADTEPWIGAKELKFFGLAGAGVIILSSAVVTCCLLVLNGALVMAILAAMAAAGVEWVENEQAGQFILFSGPICLTIIQWMMIDTLRGILRRQRHGRSEPAKSRA